MPIEPLCETGLWTEVVEPSPEFATALSIAAVDSACDTASAPPTAACSVAAWTALRTEEIEPECETAVPNEAIEPSSKSTPILSRQPLRKSETILSTQAFECEMALLTKVVVESLPECEATQIELVSEFEKALSNVSSRASPECETGLSTEVMPETATEARLETATEAVESLIERETDLRTEAVDPECEVAPGAVEPLPQNEMGVLAEEMEAFSECEAVVWTMSLPQSATAFLTESSPECKEPVLGCEKVIWIVSNWSLAAALPTEEIEPCSERVSASLMYEDGTSHELA